MENSINFFFKPSLSDTNTFTSETHAYTNTCLKTLTVTDTAYWYQYNLIGASRGSNGINLPIIFTSYYLAEYGFIRKRIIAQGFKRIALKNIRFPLLHKRIR